MNQFKDQIINLISSGRGFTQIPELLASEIPQMIFQLRNYYKNDEFFYNIVLQIRNRWEPIFSRKLKITISKFTTFYLNELEKLESLIKFAETHPEVIKIKEKELDNLSDELSRLMDPFDEVIKSFKKINIKPKMGIVKKRRFNNKSKEYPV